MPRKLRSLRDHLAPFAHPSETPPRQAQAWIVEGLLRQGEITLLAGRPKDGKTCLGATLATAVARGAEFAGRATLRTNVLYLAAEESEAEWNLALRPFLSRVCPRRLAIVHAALAIDDPETLAILKHTVERNAVGLLVVDPLLAALDLNDLSTFAAARNALAGLKALSRATNAAALVLHHVRTRPDRPLRATDNPNAARTFVLTHRPHPTARLIALTSNDRLPLRLTSLHPGHYAAYASTTRNENSLRIP